MQNAFLSKLEPRDILALVFGIGGLILISQGIDGIVGGIIIAIIAFYFAKGRKDDNTKTNQFS